jgi:hypothetical protein
MIHESYVFTRKGDRELYISNGLSSVFVGFHYPSKDQRLSLCFQLRLRLVALGLTCRCKTTSSRPISVLDDV